MDMVFSKHHGVAERAGLHSKSGGAGACVWVDRGGLFQIVTRYNSKLQQQRGHVLSVSEVLDRWLCWSVE